MKKNKLLLIFILSLLVSIDSREVIWKTTLGTLVGSVRTSLNGYDYYAFEGIPFAQAPLGNLRFKAPQPAGAWTGILNATHKSPHCYRADYMLSTANTVNLTTIESEDCLYLNIYTRNLNKIPTKNILFSIFGGGYNTGSTEQLGPEYLVDEEDLIFVTSNYRLNIFGFLSLFDTTLNVPGNAGAKDIIMALQWVHNHITEFGGNPDQVTVTGCSNGGQMVNFLMLHPFASKLFRHAISQSGSALSGLVSIELPDYEELAHYLNYTNDIRNNRAFLEHINSFSGIDLLVAYTKYRIILNQKIGYVSREIVIEPSLNNPKPFLTEYPDILIAKGAFAAKPYLVSFTFQEGGMDEPSVFETTKNYTLLTGKLPKWLSRFLSPNEIQVLHEEVKSFYYGNEEPRLHNNLLALQILGDSSLLYPNFLVWRTMASVTNFTIPLYIYLFNYSSPLNIVKSEIRQATPYFDQYYNLSCIHCDELGYLYSIKKLDTKYLSNVDETRSKVKTFKSMIMNFVRTGIPGSIDLDDSTSKLNWTPLRTKNLLEMEYLAVRDPKWEIDRIQGSIFAKRLQFWNRIYRRYKERCAPHLIYI